MILSVHEVCEESTGLKHTNDWTHRKHSVNDGGRDRRVGAFDPSTRGKGRQSSEFIYKASLE